MAHTPDATSPVTRTDTAPPPAPENGSPRIGHAHPTTGPIRQGPLATAPSGAAPPARPQGRTFDDRAAAYPAIAAFFEQVRAQHDPAFEAVLDRWHRAAPFLQNALLQASGGSLEHFLADTLVGYASADAVLGHLADETITRLRAVFPTGPVDLASPLAQALLPTRDHLQMALLRHAVEELGEARCNLPRYTRRADWLNALADAMAAQAADIVRSRVAERLR
jgi:hypothetical protein